MGILKDINVWQETDPVNWEFLMCPFCKKKSVGYIKPVWHCSNCYFVWHDKDRPFTKENSQPTTIQLKPKSMVHDSFEDDFPETEELSYKPGVPVWIVFILGIACGAITMALIYYFMRC